jgi:hypothetical protein
MSIRLQTQFINYNNELTSIKDNINMGDEGIATENFRMGTREIAKKGKTQREMDRWSKTEHEKPWTGRRGY